MTHLIQFFAHPSEFQKTILATLLGFLAGVLAEPLKIWLTESHQSRRLRRLCYQSVAQIYVMAQSVLETVLRPEGKRSLAAADPDEAVSTFQKMDIGVLKYALDSDGARFYSLDIAPTVIALLDFIHQANETGTLKKAQEMADLITNRVDGDVDDKIISGDYLTRILMNQRWSMRKCEEPSAKERKDKLRFGYRVDDPFNNDYSIRPIRLYISGWLYRQRLGPGFLALPHSGLFAAKQIERCGRGDEFCGSLQNRDFDLRNSLRILKPDDGPGGRRTCTPVDRGCLQNLVRPGGIYYGFVVRTQAVAHMRQQAFPHLFVSNRHSE